MNDFEHRVLLSLDLLISRTHAMALDLTNLTAQEKRLVADVETLLTAAAAAQKAIADLQAQIAAGSDPNVQAALDAVAADLKAEADKVETPAPAPPPTV